LVVSAREWAASASIAAEPLIAPAAIFATAMIALEASAIVAVRRLSALRPGRRERLLAWTAGCGAVEAICRLYPLRWRMTSIEELLAAARAEIPRFAPAETIEAVGRGALLVDIRQAHQRDRDGLISGAHVVERNVLEWRLDPACAHRDPRLARADVPIILICDEGYQSSLAAALLRRLGLDAGDVIGGVQGWKDARLPLAAV
jgi:rhodanese-related sulfurtransferase